MPESYIKIQKGKVTTRIVCGSYVNGTTLVGRFLEVAEQHKLVVDPRVYTSSGDRLERSPAEARAAMALLGLVFNS